MFGIVTTYEQWRFYWLPSCNQIAAATEIDTKVTVDNIDREREDEEDDDEELISRRRRNATSDHRRVPIFTCNVIVEGQCLAAKYISGIT